MHVVQVVGLLRVHVMFPVNDPEKMTPNPAAVIVKLLPVESQKPPVPRLPVKLVPVVKAIVPVIPPSAVEVIPELVNLNGPLTPGAEVPAFPSRLSKVRLLFAWANTGTNSANSSAARKC